MINNGKNILDEYDKNIRKFEYLCDIVTNLIKELLYNENINSISSRIKDKDSLKGKIDKKNGKYQKLSDITDIIGVRIITYYSDDVDKIAEIIEKEFEVDNDNSVDKRKIIAPDSFGYLSLHYVVSLNEERRKLSEYAIVKDIKFEIQIRTILQHTWAEIEHDLGYKSMIEIPREVSRDFSRLAGLLELADKEFLGIRNNLISYNQKIKESVAKDEMDNILLDVDSLKNYVENNQMIKEMNKRIVHGRDTIIIPASHQQYADMIKELNYLGCKSIKEVEDIIIRNRELAVKMACEVLTYDIDSLMNLICLFYICYAELVNSGKSKDDIVRFMEDNGFVDDEECTNEQFVENLIKIKNNNCEQRLNIN